MSIILQSIQEKYPNHNWTNEKFRFKCNQCGATIDYNTSSLMNPSCSDYIREEIKRQVSLDIEISLKNIKCLKYIPDNLEEFIQIITETVRSEFSDEKIREACANRMVEGVISS